MTLLELAERVEKATGPDRELDRDIGIALFDGGRGEMIGGALVKDRARVPIFDINQRPGMFEITAVSGTSARTAPLYTSSINAAMTLAEGQEWCGGGAGLLREAMDRLSRRFCDSSLAMLDPKAYAEALARFMTAACLRARAASADTLPKGQDGEAGLVRSKGSAVPPEEAADAQNPSARTPNK